MVVIPSMLSSMLIEFIMPTTQNKVSATLAHCASNRSMQVPEAMRIPPQASWTRNFSNGLGVVGIIGQAHEEPQ